MRIFLILVIVLLWTIPISAQKSIKTDAERLNLNGKVKKIEVYGVGITKENGEIKETSRKLRYYESFNENGNISERITYQLENENILDKMIYHFDSDGRNIGYDEFVWSLDKTLTIPRKHIFKLDDFGNMIEMKVFDMDGTSANHYTYKFDERGNLIEENFGPAIGKSIREFDKNDNLISFISYKNNQIINKTLYLYDNQNNQIGWMFYDGDKLRYKTEVIYDKQNRMIERNIAEFNAIPNVIFSHAPKVGKTIFTYNDTKKMREEILYSLNGTQLQKQIWFVNEQGEKIALDCSEPDFESCRAIIKIDYDSNNNWIRKTRLYNTYSDPVLRINHIEERKISYY